MKTLKAMCLVAVLFLFPVLGFTQDADDIMVCKRMNANGTASYMFPSAANQMKCLNGWETVALQDALSGMTSNLEASVLALELKVAELELKAPVKYDRLFFMHTGGYPTFPDPWICSDGTYNRIILPTQLPHGWDTIWDNYSGWTAVGYYKCIPGSGPSCPPWPNP